MLRRRAKPANTALAGDMTPMIDCVFNLIIFFMVVVKMTSDDFEPVELPRAEHTDQERRGAESITISLARSAGARPGEDAYRVVVSGGDVTPPRNSADGSWLVTDSKLESLLRRESGVGPGELSERSVVIRADKDCPYEYVAMVMQTLARPGIGIWKVRMATEKVGRSEGERQRE